MGETLQDVDGHRDDHRDALGVLERDGLGDELGDDKKEVGQDRERDQEGERLGDVGLEEIGDQGLADGAEEDGQDRDPDLNRGDEADRLFHQPQRNRRASLPLPRELRQPRPPCGHERVLGHDEKGVPQNEQGHQEDPEPVAHAPAPGARLLGGSSSSNLHGEYSPTLGGASRTRTPVLAPALRSRPPRADKKGGAMGSEITCLIADDHEVVREGLRLSLSRAPHIRVIGEASDGESAVALAERRRPDVVIMDIRMPGMDGLEATRQLRERLPDTSVLLFTAYGERSLLGRGLESGAKGYLLKEAPNDALVRAIEKVAHGEGYIDPGLMPTFLNRDSQEL